MVLPMRLALSKMKTLRKAMKKTQLIMMGHVQELTSRKATSRCLILTEALFKLMALNEEEAGVDNDQDTVSGSFLVKKGSC